MFLLISSVSATDIDTNDTEIISANDADEIISMEKDSDALSTNASTYSELASEIGSGGNIELKHDYYAYDKGSTIEITIDNSVINGKGATIDMANSHIRAFDIIASGVTLKNLTIKNANIDGDGGAIYFRNSGTVENCNFTNNAAKLVWSSEYDFTSVYPYRKGGAIYMSSGTVTNCNFTNNLADDCCAIYLGSGTVTNCNFINNKAEGSAYPSGAIYMSSGTVTNCNFTNNEAATGGAIHMQSGTVENCNFTNNYALEGGAITFSGNDTVTNCNFINNYVWGNGGAIYFVSVNNSESGSACTLTNCNFTGNNATAGSAIYMDGDSGTRTISNSIFLNNRANVDATIPLMVIPTENNIEITFKGQNNLLNAIYSNDDVNLTNVTYWGANGISNTGITSTTPFQSNNEAGQNITVIVVADGDIVLNVTKITDEDGKIILDIFDGRYTITARHDVDSYYTQVETTKTFTNLTSTYSNLAREIGSGGNIELKYDYYIYDDYGDSIEITTDNSVINGNGATIDMGGSNIRTFSVSASGVTIKNLTIKNANIKDDGGAIYFSSSESTHAVSNCNFTGNEAWRGGAIYFSSSGTVENCNFINNLARNGGAIYFKEIGNVTKCNFTKNSVWYDGGAVYMSLGNIINCIFNDNAAADGSGIYMRSGNVTKCNFTKNTASTYGGAIYMISGNATNCNFTNNSAQNSGGAIHFSRLDSTPTVTNCNFTNNSASFGGAIIFSGTGNVTNCNFANNNASSVGGAIYFAESSADEVINCNFTNNSAPFGGAIMFDSTGTVENCNFINNKATTGNGGAIWVDLGNVENCSFIACSASNFGGGIFFKSNLYKMYGCYFKDNSAKNGSDWYSEDEIKKIIKVSTNITASDVIVTYGNSEKFKATLKDETGATLESKNITVNIGTISKTVTTDSNGQANIDVSTLIPNTYTVTITFAGDDKYLQSNTTAKITINKQKTQITATDITTTYNTNRDLVITLKDNQDKPIANAQIAVDFGTGAKYYPTDNNGQTTIPTKGLTPNIYTAKITFEGDEIYARSDATAKITVNKEATKITADDMTTTYNTDKNLVVTLKDNQGMPITGAQIAVNFGTGAKYYPTDNNGQAKVPTKGLVPNTYEVKVTFDGDTNYMKSSTNVKVTVKKATPKITAKAKTFKKSVKTKKYSITLKDNKNKIMKNKKVTIKVNNKIYTAQTNKNGVATFKITKLNKKGTFKSTVTYKGNKYYNKVTKKINIKVK